MKKISLLIVSLVILTGCSLINSKTQTTVVANANNNQIVNDVIDKTVDTNLNRNNNVSVDELINNNANINTIDEFTLRTADKTNLFTARHNYTNEDDEKLEIEIYNVKDDLLIAQAQFDLNDNLSASSFNSLGSNNSVQLDAENGDVYYSTYGESEMTGECINEDNTCWHRIYKANIESKNQEVVFEDVNKYSQWILDIEHQVIYVLNEREEQYKINKININTKTITEISSISKDNYWYTFSGFTKSHDNKYIYQPFLQIYSDDYNDQYLSVAYIDLNTGIIESKSVYQGEAIIGTDNISPDGKYIAYYKENSKKLMLHNIETNLAEELSLNGVVKNINLKWSADSSKLLYILENELSYYDINTKNHTIVTSDPGASTSNLWYPSNQFIIYEKPASTLVVYDYVKKQIITNTPSAWEDDEYANELKSLEWL